MKKIIMLLMSLLISFTLFGCDSKNEEEIVDDSNYNLEAKYNVLHNDNSVYSVMTETEDAMISFVAVVTDKGFGLLPTYVNDGALTALVNDASSTCSIANPMDCTNIYYGVYNYYYYKGKIYNFNEIYDNETNTTTKVIESAKVDGTDRKVLYTLNDDIGIDGGYSDYIQFHNNKIYVKYRGILYIGDVKNPEDGLEMITFDGIDVVNRIYLINDTMYLTAEKYDTGESIKYNVVLKCTLDGKIEKLLYENLSVDSLDENHIYTTDYDENTMTLTHYIFDRNTLEKKEVLKTSSCYILQKDDLYLVDADVDDKKMLYIINKDGTIVYQKDYTTDGMHYPQVYTGDRLYVSIGLEKIGYYEISEDGISDLVILEAE